MLVLSWKILPVNFAKTVTDLRIKLYSALQEGDIFPFLVVSIAIIRHSNEVSLNQVQYSDAGREKTLGGGQW